MQVKLHSTNRRRHQFIPTTTTVTIDITITSCTLAVANSLVTGSQSGTVRIIRNRSRTIISPRIPVSGTISHTIIQSTLGTVDSSLPIATRRPICTLTRIPPRAISGLGITRTGRLVHQFPGTTTELTAPLSYVADSSPSHKRSITSTRGPGTRPCYIKTSHSCHPLCQNLAVVGTSFSILVVSNSTVQLSKFTGTSGTTSVLSRNNIIINGTTALHGSNAISLRVSRGTRGPSNSSTPSIIAKSTDEPKI